MKHGGSSFWYPLIGLAFVITGTDKLFGMGVYRRMFRELGWSQNQMKLVGAAELAGGTLLAAEATRSLAGVLLAGASVAVLASELRRGESNRTLPRLALLVGVTTAVWPTRSVR